MPTVPYRDPGEDVETRVADLLGRMTVEEKVGQLLVEPATGSVDEVVDTVTSNVDRHHLGQASPFGREDAPDTPEAMVEVANAIQEYAVGETRLGIPLLLISNAVHGNAYAKGAAVAPHNLGMAATRDPALLEEMASVTATELAVTGAHQNYDPICDVGREPRWGRVFETFGESPRLCGAMGAAKVRGYQGDGIAGDETVLATVKHFPAYGEPVRGEDGAVNELSESTFRRMHLRAHAEAIEAGGGAEAVMPSYAAVDGFPVHGTRKYLGDLLDDLDFDGFVVSDHHGVRMLHDDHRVTGSLRESTLASVDAGMDAFLDQPAAGTYADALVGLVESGEIDEERLDESVAPVLEAKFESGLFEDPYVDLERAKETLRTDDHREVALDAARESMTLLQNEGEILPFDPTVSEVLVAGPNADDLDHQFGGWSRGDNEDGVSVRDGVEAVTSSETTVTFEQGATMTESRDLDAVARKADDADVAVVAVGESQYIHEFALAEKSGETGEFPTRSQLALPDAQRELVETVVDSATPTAVVLVTGRPLAIADVADAAPALLMAYYPGSEGGTAVAETLFGEHNPSGTLPISMPRSAGHLPTRFNRYRDTDVVGPHEHPVSYDPLFPFGHGLSYTEFTVENLSLSAQTATPEETVEATVTVRNAGERPGATAVDCYVSDVQSSRVTPVRELGDFARVELDAGQGVEVTLSVDVSDFGVRQPEGERVVEPGTFEVRVAGETATFDVVEGADGCRDGQ
ncbi:glycoside hydrolase family 3 C-terminal domain-containing protein [Halobacteria archaeon HArc-gm2]|nr:glycoside hydrolase family 3 C-terminal domain-containing protein [Halobacteria archaeon HArc-gm2]